MEEQAKSHILVMDDEEVIRDVVHQMLDLLGYEADFAEDGATAVELYRSAMASGNPFDAVILDLTMPGDVGGQEVLEKLKELDPRVKAIACSGYGGDHVMTNFREHGFCAAISKPFQVQTLKETLERTLTSEVR